jgi:DNA-binding protein HU-beta
MNKTELVGSISDKTGLSKADSKKALDACVEAIADALKAGDKISLVGFGTFSVSERPARQGINPATKAPISIPAKKVVKFKAGSELEGGIN